MGVIYNVYDRSNEVMHDTWGHLKPKPQKKYNGWIIAYYTFNGYYGILEWDYGDLDGSPWQYAHFNAWLDKWIDEQNYIKNSGGPEMEPGLYLYEGWYKMFKNEGCQFQANDFIPMEVHNDPRNRKN